jgi:hypothetical protein
MKMVALWDIAQCSLVDVGGCFRDAYCLHHQGDEISSHFRNVDILQRHYTALYPRRLPSSSHLIEKSIPVLISSSHPLMELPNGHFFQNFSIDMLSVFIISPILA